MSKKSDNNKKKPKKKNGGSKKQKGSNSTNNGTVSNMAISPDNLYITNNETTHTVSDDSNESNWLNRVIAFFRRKNILAGFLAILGGIGTVIGIKTAFEKGKFVVTINGETKDSSIICRTYLVFFDKEEANLLKFNEFPYFSNPARYTLNDINLKYKIFSDSLTEIKYRSDYQAEDSPDDDGLAYKEVTYCKDNIKQGDTIPLPFHSFKMKDKAEARIELTATYSGYKTPFNYRANIYTKKIRQKNESNLWGHVYKEALLFLETKNNIEKFDLRYIGKRILPEHNNLTIDLLREKVASFNNTSFSEDSIEKNLDSIEVNGTMYPVQEEEVMGEMFTQKAKSDENPIPWYMHLVSVFLGSIFIIGLYVSITLILHYKKKQNIGILVFEIIVASFLSYIALFVAMRIMFVELRETGFLWVPLAFLYIMFLGLLIITSSFEKNESFIQYRNIKDLRLSRDSNIEFGFNRKYQSKGSSIKRKRYAPIRFKTKDDGTECIVIGSVSNANCSPNTNYYVEDTETIHHSSQTIIYIIWVVVSIVISLIITYFFI